jgi:hypothetical protein
MLFPERLSEKTDLKEQFYGRNRWFFALAAVLPPLNFVDTYLKGYEHLLAQGSLYIFTLVLVSTMCAIEAATDNEKYHKFFSVFFFVYIMDFMSINLSVLA